MRNFLKPKPSTPAKIQPMTERKFAAKGTPTGGIDAQFALAVGKKRFKLRIAFQALGHSSH